METVCNCSFSYIPCYVTAYGNGISPPKIPRTTAQATQALSCYICVRQCKTVSYLTDYVTSYATSYVTAGSYLTASAASV
jgi:hypothetical protein